MNQAQKDRKKADDFEIHVAELFERQGYDAQKTEGSGDGGIDVFLKKGGKTYGVECKYFSPDNKVGRPILQKLDSALHQNPYTSGSMDGGFCVTTSGYSQEAIDWAADADKRYGKTWITLIDGEELRRMEGEPSKINWTKILFRILKILAIGAVLGLLGYMVYSGLMLASNAAMPAVSNLSNYTNSSLENMTNLTNNVTNVTHQSNVTSQINLSNLSNQTNLTNVSEVIKKVKF